MRQKLLQVFVAATIFAALVVSAIVYLFDL